MKHAITNHPAKGFSRLAIVNVVINFSAKMIYKTIHSVYTDIELNIRETEKELNKKYSTYGSPMTFPKKQYEKQSINYL